MRLEAGFVVFDSLLAHIGRVANDHVKAVGKAKHPLGVKKIGVAVLVKRVPGGHALGVSGHQRQLGLQQVG